MSPNGQEPEVAQPFRPPRTPASRDWVAIVACVAVAAGIVGLGVCWAHPQETWKLQERLAGIVVWDFRVIGLALLAGGAVVCRNGKWFGGGVPPGTKGWLAAICLWGLVVAVFVAPRTNRLFYDEHIYQNVAQTIAFEGRALACNQGTAEYGVYHCDGGEYYKQPAGWPFLLSLAFQLCGVHEWVAHTLNNLLMVAATVCMFGVALLLFGSARAALFAALVYVLVPLNSLWFNTASAEPSAACAALLSVLGTLLFVRQPSHPTCAWAVAANALAIQFRAESVLVLAVNAALIWCLNPRQLREPRLYAWGVPGAALALPQMWHLFAFRGHNWGSDSDKFSLAIFHHNLGVNGPFYWDNARFPVLFTALALVGLFCTGKWRRKAPLVVWFGLFWGIFLFFYAGSYNYGVDVRFSLVSYAPLALLAGLGCSALAGWTERMVKSPRAVAVAPMALLLCWMPFLPLIRGITEEAWAAREDVRFAKEFATLLPPHSIVLTHNPNLFLLMGKNAAQMSIITYHPSQADDNLFARFDGGVYLHWNYWCNAHDELQRSFAERVLQMYPATLVAEHQVRDFRYALYRLERPPSEP